MTWRTPSTSIANCSTERQLRSVCTTTLAMLRWTKSSPGASPTISFAGTRLSEQPIQRYSGFCCSCRRAKNRGSCSSMCAAQAALLANRRSSSGMRPAYHVRMTPQTSFEPSPLAPRPSPDDQARDRDLGFGSVVSRESRQRLLNPDGSFNVARYGLGFLDSFAPYHLLLTISWPGFLGIVGASYLTLNFLFAFAYLACGQEALVGAATVMFGGAFGRAFFFSIETFATIGYGQMAPNGVVATLVVTVEALVGLMYQALATGLLFARFTRPSAALLFSRNAVIAPYGTGQGLMFRLANRRRNEIIELEAQVLFSAMEPDGRGGLVRRYTPLALERNKV